jgi:hypothetical protein
VCGYTTLLLLMLLLYESVWQKSPLCDCVREITSPLLHSTLCIICVGLHWQQRTRSVELMSLNPPNRLNSEQPLVQCNGASCIIPGCKSYHTPRQQEKSQHQHYPAFARMSLLACTSDNNQIEINLATKLQ